MIVRHLSQMTELYREVILVALWRTHLLDSPRFKYKRTQCTHFKSQKHIALNP